MELFFNNVTFPGLQELSIGEAYPGPFTVDIVYSFLLRSPNELKSLELVEVDVTGEQLIHIAQTKPSLQTLNISLGPGSSDDQLNVFYQALRSHLPADDDSGSLFQPLLLPSLQVFKWTGHCAFPWEFISAFLVPLSVSDPSTRRPLATINVTCRNMLDPIAYVSEGVLAELSPFMDSVQFDFRILHDDLDEFDLWEMSLEHLAREAGPVHGTGAQIQMMT